MKRCLLSRIIVFLFAFAATFELCAAAPKYVFLFIGDGLSFPQRMMTEEFSRITRGQGLKINAMPFQSASTTFCADRFITDSAASGTAIACGEKTNFGMLGVSPSGAPLTSAATVAKRSGRKVAIVTSVTINHATPGAFYAHQKNRSSYYNIGLELIDSGFDYFGGGGVQNHVNKSGGDIYKIAAAKGMTVLRSIDAVRNFKPGSGRILAAPYPANLPYAIDRKAEDLKLTDFVRQAIEHCYNQDKGFFIMAEGGAIDWFCHANDASGALHEVIDFDDAVAVALDFYQKHPKDTLIVVTGDHETGGLTLGFAGTGYRSYFKLLAAQKCSYTKMAEAFNAPGKNGKPVTWQEIQKVIHEVSGLIFPQQPQRKVRAGTLTLSAGEIRQLRKAFDADYPKGIRNSKSYQLCRCTMLILNNKAGVAWTTGSHTALPVNTTAIGDAGAMFTTAKDNTDIARLLKIILE